MYRYPKYFKHLSPICIPSTTRKDSAKHFDFDIAHLEYYKKGLFICFLIKYRLSYLSICKSKSCQSKYFQSCRRLVEIDSHQRMGSSLDLSRSKGSSEMRQTKFKTMFFFLYACIYIRIHLHLIINCYIGIRNRHLNLNYW